MAPGAGGSPQPPHRPGSATVLAHPDAGLATRPSRLRRQTKRRCHSTSESEVSEMESKRSAVVGSAGAAGPLSLREVERQHIARVLANSPTLGVAAARLGIDVSTLWRKRRRYRIK